MIPAIMIGVAAILFILSIISLQIAGLKEQGALASGGLLLLFLLNLAISSLLVLGALGSSVLLF